MRQATADQPADSVESRGETTRQRILDAAERLFSEHGINGVSLRTIVAEAGVNTAAVHYHFGSKQGLLEAVFARHAAPMAEERMALLAACSDGPGRPPLLEQIIEAFLVPGMRGRHGGTTFARLRARMIAETSEETRDMYSRYFDESTSAYIAALGRALPELPGDDVHWRFHVLLGAMVYTLMNPGRIQVITHGSCDPSDPEAAVEYLVPLLAHMFRAEAIPVSRVPIHEGRPQTSPTST